MGWLSNVFGPRKAEVREEAAPDKPLTLSEVSGMLEARARERDAFFEGEARSLHGGIMKSLDDFSSALSNLDKAKEPDKIDGRLLELGKSYRTSLSKSFNQMFLEARKPTGFGIVEFSDYCRKVSSLLNQSEKDAMRYVQMLKEIYPDAMRRLLKESDRMEESVSSAVSKADSRRAEIEPLIGGMSVLKEIEMQVAKVQRAESEIAYAKSELAKLKARKSEIELRSAEIMKSDAWLDYQRRVQDLTAMRRRKDEIASVILQSIVSLDKAMKRMKKRLSESSYSFEHSGMLDLYINDPLDAFLKDPDQKVIREIVAVISRMAQVHDLELDDRREQKVLEKLSVLKSGEFLSNLRFDYDKCVDSIASMEEWIASAEVISQNSRNAEDLKSTLMKISATEDEILKLTSVMEKERATRDSMHAMLGDLAKKALGDKVSLAPL